MSQRDLPEECWELILNRIDHHSHFESLSLVSKQFISLTNRLRQSLTIVDPTPSTQFPISDLLQRFPNLKVIDLSECHNNLNTILFEIAHAPILRLESLNISNKIRFPLRDLVESGLSISNLRISCTHSTENRLMEVNPSEITIRPYKASDVDDFMVYAGDDRVTQFTRWNTFTSRNEALTYIQECCINHPFCRSICLGDRSIGYISITPQSGNDECRAEVGYALAAKYWGQGITCQALRVSIRDVFVKFPQLARLQALVAMENKGSHRVLEKVGFLKEGVLRKYCLAKGEIRDLMIFSLLSSDPM
ncbi:hypothetical protein RJ640_011423 [Escallonia rubra]|uniref:N-acetyltransferase domain-containing protein n=1 Tax=Escallonia rubra TaxID=112253 RepID=A0AA88REE1_9ASTE|nr:hypothetical protein RJ640_011423 [Escallonia rubra]